MLSFVYWHTSLFICAGETHYRNQLWTMHIVGLPQLHYMYSRVYRFTGLYNSQWILHFVAPFIDHRTNTTIATLAAGINHPHQHICYTHKCNYIKYNIHCTPNVIIDFTSYICAQYLLYIRSMHEWSFRRFTFGNLVTTSPSSKW